MWPVWNEYDNMNDMTQSPRWGGGFHENQLATEQG